MSKLFIVLIFSFSLKTNALIGGADVLEGDPISKSIVALQMAERQADGSVRFYKGSGVLISQNVVLTAGHNFFYLKDVTASQAILSVAPTWGGDSHGQKRIHVESVSLYPGFSQGPLGTQHDLAIVFLVDPVPSEYVPLKIALSSDEPPALGEKGMLLGYGRSSEDPSAPLSDYRLRRISLKVTRWDNNSIVDSQKIWFSNQNGSIVGGDSGGPVLFKRDNSLKIFGIGLHGRYDTCIDTKTCEPQSAYANTTFLANWINSALNVE